MDTIQTTPVTRPSQIVVGDFYLIVGTNSWGEPIPPQIIRVRECPKVRGAIELPFIRYNATVNVGKIRRTDGGVESPVMLNLENQQAFLYEFNIFNETDDSIVQELMPGKVGHDLHLRHVTHGHKLMSAFGVDTSYTDVAKTKPTPKPKKKVQLVDGNGRAL